MKDVRYQWDIYGICLPRILMHILMLTKRSGSPPSILYYSTLKSLLCSYMDCVWWALWEIHLWSAFQAHTMEFKFGPQNKHAILCIQYFSFLVCLIIQQFWVGFFKQKAYCTPKKRWTRSRLIPLHTLSLFH